jgi:hypothetical protein
MSDNFELDLTTWLDSVAPSRAPDEVLSVALDRTAGVRQRPGWLVAERWTTVQSTLTRTRVPRRAFAILVVALIALAIVAAVLIGGVGRGPLTPPRLAIAFTVGSGNSAYIDAMTATGTNVTRLAGPPSGVSGGWTLNGSRLLFGSSRDGSHDDVYAMDPDGSNQTRLTHSPHASGAEPVRVARPILRRARAPLAADWPRPSVPSPPSQRVRRRPPGTCPRRRSRP